MAPVAPDPPPVLAHLSSQVLVHLAAAYHRNPQAEVSGAELQYRFGLDLDSVRAVAAALAAEGLVEWDPLLTNVWLRITDSGLAAAEHARGSYS